MYLGMFMNPTSGISIIVETFLRFIVKIKKENIMQSMLYKYYVYFFSGA